MGLKTLYRNIKAMSETEMLHSEDPRIWPNVFGDDWPKGKVTKDLQSQLEANVLDIYACSIIRANACATVSYSLYRTVTSKSKKKDHLRLTKCKIVPNEKKDYIFRQSHLQRYTKSADDIEEVVKHPFLDILYDVNPIQNLTNLKFLTTNLQDLSGNAYWLILLNQMGMPVEIYPNKLMPQYMATDITYDDNGKMIISYVFRKGADKEKRYTSKEVVHFMYDDPNNMLGGLSPVAAAAGTINEQYAMNDFLSDYLLNQTRMTWALMNKGAFMDKTKKAELKASYREHTRGAEKNTPMLLQGDLGILGFPDRLENLPFIQNKKLDTQTIYRIFGIPEALAFNESSNRATIDVASDRQFMGMTIKPLLTRIEETINQNLLSVYYGGEIFGMYDDCVPSDKEFELSENKASLGGLPWKRINEIRQAEGLDPDPNGDVLYIPQGMIPMGSSTTTQQLSIDEMTVKVLERVKEKMKGGS